MKTKLLGFFMPMGAAFAITFAFLSFLPAQIPVHFNSYGEADRIGSKYEMLILPCFIVIIGIIFLAATYYLRKKQEHRNEKVVFITGTALLIFLNLINVYILLMVSSFDSSAGNDLFDFYIIKLPIMLIGALLIVLGNVMPKATKNRFFGLRTKWSMANDTVWQKTQRIGGFTTVLCGILIVLAAVIFNGTLLFCVLGALMIVWITAAIYLSYAVYKRNI